MAGLFPSVPSPIKSLSWQRIALILALFYNRVWYTSYKGSFEGRIFSINMYGNPSAKKASAALTDMAISAKASSHKNILKLVGCCLETSIPSLVYEYAQNGVLADRIYISRRQDTPIVWQNRLKIARQIAHAIAYLHTAFSRPIIHRDIKPGNIFLDHHDVPKLTDFSLSISIPEGETHVEDEVCGILGFICPSYITTGYLRNSTGVDEICDPTILAEEGGASVEEQLQAVRQLGLTCIEDDPKIRPTMVDVTKELRRIERSIA